MAIYIDSLTVPQAAQPVDNSGSPIVDPALALLKKTAKPVPAESPNITYKSQSKAISTGTTYQLIMNDPTIKLPPNYEPYAALQLDVGGGNLHCCGMGTLGGFNMYWPNAALKQFALPTAKEMEAYVRMVLKGCWPEMIGIMNAAQYERRAFWEILFDFQVIHETTNKNYGGSTFMRVIKIDRSSSTARVSKGTVANLYSNWVKENYPNYKGKV